MVKPHLYIQPATILYFLPGHIYFDYLCISKSYLTKCLTGRANPCTIHDIMKVYVVFLIKTGVEEVIGVRRSPQAANKLIDGRNGYFTEYETNPKK